MASSNYVWLCHDKGMRDSHGKPLVRFQRVKLGDPRLSFDTRGERDRARFMVRGKPSYPAWGATKQEAADDFNRWASDKIGRLELEIAGLRRRMITVGEDGGNEGGDHG